MQFKRRAYITTAGTVPAAEAFLTLNIVSTEGTDTKLNGTQYYNGGIAQIWNESTARAITVKMYYSMKDSPGALNTGDWIEYDSVSVTADDGTTAGTAVILWSRPYKWLAFTSSATAETTNSIELEVFTY
jgi:hypothetical protein